MQKYSCSNTTALDVANYILLLADTDGADIDPITLQKMLYFCQCWSLRDGQRLFDDPVEAWKHGPVVRSVWKAYSGSTKIRRPDDPRFFELGNDQMELVQGVWSSLRNTHGFTLSKKTHEPGSAWTKTRKGLPETARSAKEIPLQDMADEAGRIQQRAQQELTDAWDDLVNLQQ